MPTISCLLYVKQVTGFLSVSLFPLELTFRGLPIFDLGKKGKIAFQYTYGGPAIVDHSMVKKPLLKRQIRSDQSCLTK